MDYKTIIDFWFGELSMKEWFMKSDELDATIKERFGELLEKAGKGELQDWRSEDEGRLAEIIVLDQFSRNVYRNTPQAFSQDGLAIQLSMEAEESGAIERLDSQQKKMFALMPFMHSESSEVHEKGLELFEKYGLDTEYEIKHKVIIDRFGRYPHRNEILGRESTPEEIEFLKGPDSSF